jgi:hypothetical protein
VGQLPLDSLPDSQSHPIRTASVSDRLRRAASDPHKRYISMVGAYKFQPAAARR